MEQETWLPIAQYAIKKGTSVSTLRRKIKKNSIEFKLESGRYLIKDKKAAEKDFRNLEKDTSVFPYKSNSPASIQKNSYPRIPVKKSPELHTLQAKIEELSGKVNYLEEQSAELNMLVRVFEEKLDSLL